MLTGLTLSTPIVAKSVKVWRREWARVGHVYCIHVVVDLVCCWVDEDNTVIRVVILSVHSRCCERRHEQETSRDLARLHVETQNCLCFDIDHLDMTNR